MVARIVVTLAAVCLIVVGLIHSARAKDVVDAPSATGGDKLTVLFDAFGNDPRLQKGWGYAALIEVGGRRILFDTGNDPDVFAHNVKVLGVDLSHLDFVVMSHRHGDHTSGLAHLLSVNPSVKIYAPREGFGVFGASLPSTFYRRDSSLPIERRYFDDAPDTTLHFGSAWPKADIALVEKTTEIAPGIHLIALVSDKPGTLEMRELSLAIETPRGIVLVVGCSHPGIGRIAAAAREIDPRIHFIAGGLHLVTTSQEEVIAELGLLSDTFNVSWIAAGHCTGEPAFAALAKLFGSHDLYAGLGTTISLGSNPRHAMAGKTRYARNVDDMLAYRATWRSTLTHFGRRTARSP